MKVANINFVYGVQDWMTPGNAFRVQQTVAARRLAGGYAEAVPGGGGAGSSSSGGGPNIAVSLIGTFRLRSCCRLKLIKINSKAALVGCVLKLHSMIK